MRLATGVGWFMVLALASAATSADEPLTTRREVRAAEAAAKTAEDHLRLAAYYRLKGREAEANLREAEEQMKQWSSMADRTKIPNPYWSARARAGMFRADLNAAAKLARKHETAAESLKSGPNQ